MQEPARQLVKDSVGLAWGKKAVQLIVPPRLSVFFGTRWFSYGNLAGTKTDLAGRRCLLHLFHRVQAGDLTFTITISLLWLRSTAAHLARVLLPFPLLLWVRQQPATVGYCFP